MILSTQDLKLYFRTRRGPLKAVDGVSVGLKEGKTLAIVGESGAGKSAMAVAILRTLPRNIHTYEGDVFFEGTNIMELSDEEFRKSVRWRGISTVFQGAMNSLNPVMEVGDQIIEPLEVHWDMGMEKATNLLEESLEDVGLRPDVKEDYPHELSGGMKQRIVIAMALIMRPKLIILDEPTSALDTMTGARILNLLKDLKAEENLSYIFITHDLSQASELADELAIMYAGEMVERGSAEKIYEDPDHPYTEKLLASVPRLKSDEVPEFIPGSPPDLVDPPEGCRFHPRCDLAEEICRKKNPVKSEVEPSCWIRGD